MNEYVILIGLATSADLGEDAERDKSKRLWAICDLVFSMGPAWQGNQGSILLKTDLTADQIVERIAPIVTPSDLVGVIEINTKSITTIGWTADQEGLHALYPGVLKVDRTLDD